MPFLVARCRQDDMRIKGVWSRSIGRWEDDKSPFDEFVQLVVSGFHCVYLFGPFILSSVSAGIWFLW